jgi:hypothetical protein
MNMQELSDYLRRECYQPGFYHVGSDWESCGDTFCIDRVGDRFEVFYVERGQRGAAIRSCDTEAAACEAFLAVLDGERFACAHCVGIFTAQSEADTLAQQLASATIKFHRDAIPYGGPLDKRHRIFVFGRDKIRFDELMHGKQSVAYPKLPGRFGPKVASYPECSYGAVRVCLVLKDGRRIPDVIIGADAICKIGQKEIKSESDLGFAVSDIEDVQRG